jgi:predicted XRE-type DNA-binding protein
MSKMSELDAEINDLLSSTNLMIDEIAAVLDIPVTMVENVVAYRWQRIVESVGEVS